MKIVVLKFGGTSVGSTDRIKKVANIIISYVRKNYKVIVTSSSLLGSLGTESNVITGSVQSANHDLYDVALLPAASVTIT